MRKSIVAGAALALATLATLATGCAPAEVSIEEGLETLYETAPSQAVVPEELTIELGMTICEAFDAGVNTNQVIALARMEGFTHTEGQAFVTFSTTALCPENKE